ncbi:MAG: hypothetical protein J5I90_14195 [Caldilineales bacterium]|nr:hypothetical protein [Caldilineales bacterium]
MSLPPRVLLIDVGQELRDRIPAGWVKEFGFDMIDRVTHSSQVVDDQNQGNADVVLINDCQPDGSLEFVRHMRMKQPAVILGVFSPHARLDRQYISAGADYVFPLPMPDPAMN